MITDELINERLEAKGFGEKQSMDYELCKQSVLDHYGVEFADYWGKDLDFYIYEESTADGYSVYIATDDIGAVNVSEHVYYYDSDLKDALADYIQYAKKGSRIYIDDLYSHFVEEAIVELFSVLSEHFEEEIIKNS
ncbi:MAG: hypothetical protein ACR2M9_03300 [Cyanophyceae cyanobacterium]